MVGETLEEARTTADQPRLADATCAPSKSAISVRLHSMKATCPRRHAQFTNDTAPTASRSDMRHAFPTGVTITEWLTSVVKCYMSC